eukprot:7620236-Alexandrium_andersonii.AAC.1
MQHHECLSEGVLPDAGTTKPESSGNSECRDPETRCAPNAQAPRTATKGSGWAGKEPGDTSGLALEPTNVPGY